MKVVRLLGRELLAVRSVSIELAAETLAVKGGERADAGNASGNSATRAARKDHFSISPYITVRRT
jgi:hypothetical protein